MERSSLREVESGEKCLEKGEERRGMPGGKWRKERSAWKKGGKRREVSGGKRRRGELVKGEGGWRGVLGGNWREDRSGQREVEGRGECKEESEA